MTHISSPFLCLKSSIEVLVRHNFSLLLRKEKIKACVGLVCFLGADFFSFFFNLYCLKHLELTQQKEEENPGQLYSITELVKRKEKTKIISTVYEYVFLRNYNKIRI